MQVEANQVEADVVQEEVVAVGRDSPMYMMLGGDERQAVNDQTKKVVGIVEEWECVTTNLQFDDFGTQ